jgi:septal ring factor EnvC (AmiA/AmiB activator)
MSNILKHIKNFLMVNVVTKYPNTFNFVRNLFAFLGLFTTLYLIFLLAILKPKMIQESENKIQLLNQEIKENDKQISKLEKENKKISNQMEKLNDQLGDLQIKNKKYVKEHEKNTSRISSMSNNQLSRVFADSFDE